MNWFELNTGGWRKLWEKVAAKNMVHTNAQIPMRSVPVFWTVAYGKAIRYAGHGIGVTETLIDYLGAAKETQPNFAAYYLRKGVVIAVSAMGLDPFVSDFASLLSKGIKLTKEEIEGPVSKGNSVQYVHDKLLKLAKSCGSKE